MGNVAHKVRRCGGGEMAAATMALPCSSSSSTTSPPLPSSSSRPLFLHLPSSSPCRLPLLLPIRTRPLASTSPRSSSSYNGWDDLAALPDPPSPLPLHFLLLPLPVAALSLSLSRLPPLPLLAAAFTAGFATSRHLTPSPPSSHPHHQRLADLDARLLSFKDQLTPSGAANNDALLDAVDRARDGILEYASTATTTTSADGALGDVAREVAGYFGGWARDTLRDLTFASPRKKPKEPVVDAKTDSDALVVDKDAQAQQWDGDKHSDSSSIQPSTRHAGIPEGKALGSAVTQSARPLDMLPFDGNDAGGLQDTGLSAHSMQEDDRLERLVFKHRHGHGRSVQNDDPFEGGRFETASTESSLLERTLEIRDRSYRLRIERRNGGESRASEARERPADEFMGNAAGEIDEPIDDEGAATGSDGEEFSHNVKEAAEILRKVRECMMARADEETADALLYRSARLLSTAVALRPTSLVAVGQLGNTYLLHGELKLKISRELRTLLANSRAYLNGREHVSRSRKLDRRILNRENISSALVGVCEECESLLVEAGRSYRMAVSIDSGDVKALYNWGLALTFRAQLLADIGPEAAVDADRVYLAAIDKFDAMLSKSNTYAPEALYRWGSALQQRSQLRSRNNKEKIRLLEQAKSLFEDVLYVEADNKMVREALSSCISELNYHGRWL